jgi:hypothetical protein
MGTAVSHGLIGNRLTVNLPLAAADLPNRLPQPIDRRRARVKFGSANETRRRKPAGVAKFTHHAMPDSVPARALSRHTFSAGAARLKELVAKRLVTARKLPTGQNCHNALQEIGRFRARITCLRRTEWGSAHPKAEGEGK